MVSIRIRVRIRVKKIVKIKEELVCLIEKKMNYENDTRDNTDSDQVKNKYLL